MSQSKTSIFPVLLVNFIGMLGYSIVIPMLIFLVNDFGGNEFIYGLLVAMYPGFQLIGAPVLGKWSDNIGRKRVLMISQVGTFLAWLLFILALFLPKNEMLPIDNDVLGTFTLTIPLILIFLARALDGLTGGNISVANAYLSDISTEENRKQNFGKMGASTSLGFIIGPAVAGLLAGLASGNLITLFLASAISFIAIIVIWQILPDSKSRPVPPASSSFSMRKILHTEHKECYQMENCPDTGFKGILKQTGIPTLYGIYFLTFLSWSFYYAGLPIYASSSLGWDTSQLGIYLTYGSIIMVLVQGPLLSWFSTYFSEYQLMIAGSIFMGLSFYFFTGDTNIEMYTGSTLLALGNGVMWPSYMAQLSRSGNPSIQGSIQGYANSMGSLGSIIGLIVGGFLFGQIGANMFLISMVIFVLIILLTQILKNQSKALA